MQDIQYDVFISYSNFDKYIADAACHFIEARKLRCFIAPRDITTPDWAGCITNAIAHSKAFVVIVSEHSIDSPEVSKEITLATRVSNYIFPFLIEDTQMNERMAYHLSAYHWIDAITPPIEQRLNELADRVVSALTNCDSNEKTISCTTNLNKSARRLIGQNVSPRAEFIGREKELKTMETLFDNGATNVFLTGMGGIGKSEIAKAYAKRRKNQYHTVVFANYESDLMHMIASDQTVFVENLSRSVASGGQAETLEDYYLRKMEVLRTILDRNTLLIIDNFDVDADDEMERIMALPCDIVWTTRTDFSAFGYDTVTIGPMDDMNALICLYERMDRSYPAECEREAMKAIIERLEHHTFAVSLTAAQGKAAHMKPTKMLEKLLAEGLEIQTSSGFVREVSDRRKMTAYMYIEKLFDFSKISEEACQLMRLMAIMPREGVTIDLFMECAAIDDFGVIEELISKNWIRLDEEADRINLHMLVHEVVWKHLVPTVENCSRLLEGAYHKVKNAWNTSYEENCRMESMIYAILYAFPEPTAAYFDYFEAFATYCWIQGNFSLAEQYEMKLYALSCAAWGECSMHTGSAALRVAAVYHNQADYAAARPWYEKGLEIQSKSAPGTPQNAVALSKVARCCAQNQDLLKAEEMICASKILYENQLSASEQLHDEEEIRKAKIGIAFCSHNLAQIYTLQGNADQGYPLAMASYEILKTDKVETSLVIYAMQALAFVLYHQGKYTEARKYIEECIEQMIFYHGKDRIDVLLYQEVLGDCAMQAEQFEEAKGCYAEVLHARETLFPADAQSMLRLEEKYEKALSETKAYYPMYAVWT